MFNFTLPPGRQTSWLQLPFATEQKQRAPTSATSKLRFSTSSRVSLCSTRFQTRRVGEGGFHRGLRERERGGKKFQCVRKRRRSRSTEAPRKIQLHPLGQILRAPRLNNARLSKLGRELRDFITSREACLHLSFFYSFFSFYSADRQRRRTKKAGVR